MIQVSAALSVFIVSYALIATERVHRVAAALGSAARRGDSGFMQPGWLWWS